MNKNLIVLFFLILGGLCFAQEDFFNYNDYTLNPYWRYSNNYEVGWDKLDFDDSNWQSLPPNNENFINYDNPNWHHLNSNEVLYLRRTIQTNYYGDNPSQRVYIKITVNDDFELYVNNTLVATDQNNLAGPFYLLDVSAWWNG